MADPVLSMVSALSAPSFLPFFLLAFPASALRLGLALSLPLYFPVLRLRRHSPTSHLINLHLILHQCRRGSPGRYRHLDHLPTRQPPQPSQQPSHLSRFVSLVFQTYPATRLEGLER